MDWNTQTNWLYGEVGSRLDSNRGNEYFQYSAKELKNLYITQTGTLRVMKQWIPQDLSIPDPVVSVLETRYSFYIMITTKKVYIKELNTHRTISEYAVNTPQDSNCALFFNTHLSMIHDNQVTFLQFDAKTGANLRAYDFKSEFKPPLKDRQPVQFDVHRVYEESYIEKTDPTTGVVTIGKRKVISRIATQTLDPRIKLDSSGHILLDSIGGKVVRIYGEPILEFRGGEDIDLTNIKYGELIINFTTGIPTNLLFDTSVVTWDAQKTDHNRNYVTKVNNTNLYGKEGDLRRGAVIPAIDNITSLTVFQNRLVITDEESIYFSKVNDYTDFTNYVEDDSPFYIKPNPIINEQPLILNTYSSRGLYIVTNKGIYVMGYNVTLTPASATVETVSDTPATRRVAMIDSNFFFIGVDKSLYSVQEDAELSTSRLFKYVVEKYDLNFVVEDITVVRFDKFKRLLVKEIGGATYLYDVILGVDTFRRTTFDLEYDRNSRIFGINEDLITDGTAHNYSQLNYQFAKIKVHQPSGTVTQSGGTLANDDNTIVEGGQIAIINEGGDSIKEVKIDGVPCSNLGSQVNMMSLYFIKNLHMPIAEGFYYEVETDQGMGTVEITALEYLFEPAGLY